MASEVEVSDRDAADHGAEDGRVSVLGTHIPLSCWTAVVLVVGGVLSLMSWRSLARCFDWRPPATLAGLLFLTTTFALTLTPDGDQTPPGLATCIPHDLLDLAHNLVHTGGGLGGDALNFLLMLPLTTSLVLASRRVGLGVAVAILLPIAIELTQTVVPGRYCAVTDMLTNSSGALLGVVLGWLAGRRA